MGSMILVVDGHSQLISQNRFEEMLKTAKLKHEENKKNVIYPVEKNSKAEIVRLEFVNRQSLLLQVQDLMSRGYSAHYTLIEN